MTKDDLSKALGAHETKLIVRLTAVTGFMVLLALVAARTIG